MASKTLSFVGEFPSEPLVGAVEGFASESTNTKRNSSSCCCSVLGTFWTLSSDTVSTSGQTRKSGNGVVVVVRDSRSGTIVKIIRTVARIPFAPSLSASASESSSAPQSTLDASALVSVGGRVWVGTNSGLVHIFDARTYAELHVLKVSDSAATVSQMVYSPKNECVFVCVEGSPLIFQFDASFSLNGADKDYEPPRVERYTLPQPQRPSVLSAQQKKKDGSSDNAGVVVCVACSEPFLFVASSDGYVFLFRTDSRSPPQPISERCIRGKGFPKQPLVRLQLRDCVVSENNKSKAGGNRVPATLAATNLYIDAPSNTVWIGTNCGTVLFLPYDLDALCLRGASDKQTANSTADGEVQLLLDGHRALTSLQLSPRSGFASTPHVTGFIHVSRKILISVSDSQHAYVFAVDANTHDVLQTTEIPNHSRSSAASISMVPLFVSETARIGVVSCSGSSSVSVYDADGFFVPANSDSAAVARTWRPHGGKKTNSSRVEVHLDPLAHLESSALSLALAEADQMLAAKDEEIRLLKNESQGYLLRTHDVKQQSTDFEVELKALQKRYDEQKSELNTEREKVASLNETIGTLQREKKMLEEQVAAEQQRVAAGQQEITRLMTTRLAELETAAGALRGEKDDLQRRLKEAEESRDYITNTFQRLLGDSSSSSSAAPSASGMSDIIGQAVRDRDNYKAQVEDTKRSMQHLHRALVFKHMCENDLIALLKGFKGKACNAVSDERLHALLHVLLFRHPTMFDVANDEVIAEDPVLLASMPEERLIEYLDKLKAESTEKYNAFIRAFTNPEDRKAWGYESHLTTPTPAAGNGEANGAGGGTGGVLSSLLDRLKPNSPTQRQGGDASGTAGSTSHGNEEDILTTLSKLLGTPANALSTPSVVDRLSSFLVSSHLLGVGGLTGISREEYLLFQFILDTRQELAHRIAQLHQSVHSLYRAVKIMCTEGDAKDVAAAAALRASASANGTVNTFPSKSILRQDRTLLRLAEHAYGQTSVLAGNLLTMLEKSEYASQLAV